MSLKINVKKGMIIYKTLESMIKQVYAWSSYLSVKTSIMVPGHILKIEIAEQKINYSTNLSWKVQYFICKC